MESDQGLESIINHQFHKFPCFVDDQKNPTEVTSCVFDATGQRLACAFGDHRVLVLSQNDENEPIERWNKATCSVSTKATIIQVNWNADGTLIAAADFNDLFYIFSPHEAKLLSFMETESNLTKIKWNRKGAPNLLLTSGDNGTVIVWNTSEETPWHVKSFDFHTSGVRDIRWLSKATFASCSLDGSIYVCHINRDEPLHSFFHDYAILSIHFNVKYDYISFFSYDETVKLWKLGEEGCLREWEGHQGAIYSIGWNESDDCSMLASGGEDKTVRIWSIHSSLCEKVLNDLSALVSAVSFSPNGRYLAAADTNGVVAVWSTKCWSLMLRRQCACSILDINSLNWNAKSKKLVIATQSGEIYTIEWNPATDVSNKEPSETDDLIIINSGML